MEAADKPNARLCSGGRSDHGPQNRSTGFDFMVTELSSKRKPSRRRTVPTIRLLARMIASQRSWRRLAGEVGRHG